MTFPVVQQAAAGSGLGIASHLLYFIRGEHHKQAVKLTQVAFAVPSLLVLALIRVGELSVLDALGTPAILTSAFYVGLWSSMLVHRALFHRLRSFPGPF